MTEKICIILSEGDNMNLFEIILFDSTFLIYPLLYFIIYMLFVKTLDKKKNNLCFDFAIITAFYLLVKFGINSYKGMYLLFIDMLLLIAYLYRQNRSVIIINLLLIFYYYNLGINIYLLILEYIIYFAIYLYSKKHKKVSFVDIFLLIKIFIVYHFYYFSLGDKISIKYHNFIILMFALYIIAKLLSIIFKRAIAMCSLYKSVQNMEDDKNTKESLFKITHEIKNPIAVVKGYLDMFNVNNIENSKKYIPIIKEEINRVLVLLEDFLSITKIQVIKEEMDLGMLFDDVNDSFGLILSNKNIKLNYKKADEVYIFADYNRLKQVLVNLLKNSVESIQEVGNINIDYTFSTNRIKIIVSDNGIGMDKQELESLKNAFFTTKKNGTGLGIYLSNEIIEKHGGHMKYESIKNKGTKVTISLPYKKAY